MNKSCSILLADDGQPAPDGLLHGIDRKALGIVEENKGSRYMKNIREDLTKKDKAEPALKTVKSLIAQNPFSGISRDKLAEAVFMSPDYLTRIFKKRRQTCRYRIYHRQTSVPRENAFLPKRISV
ncbi:MAG: helix-turn-helix transcriptional regulator [Parasporobacterium sp.]|nr:helix-turn-helix transcriptional regulator [Parasporobacterium sp.]